jgi:hypothetical protein
MAASLLSLFLTRLSDSCQEASTLSPQQPQSNFESNPHPLETSKARKTTQTEPTPVLADSGTTARSPESSTRNSFSSTPTRPTPGRTGDTGDDGRALSRVKVHNKQLDSSEHLLVFLYSECPLQPNSTPWNPNVSVIWFHRPRRELTSLLFYTRIVKPQMHCRRRVLQRRSAR